MSKYQNAQNSELFSDVSEQEQEIAAGGIQILMGSSRELIHSAGAINMNLSGGGSTFSISDSSQYTRLRESNYILFDFNSYYYPGRKYSVSPMRLIQRIMRLFS